MGGGGNGSYFFKKKKIVIFRLKCTKSRQNFIIIIYNLTPFN